MHAHTRAHAGIILMGGRGGRALVSFEPQASARVGLHEGDPERVMRRYHLLVSRSKELTLEMNMSSCD